MFNGFSSRTIDFMWGIRLNNNKLWFEEHKDEYKREFLEPMKELGREILERMNDACGDHGFVLRITRIYKDAGTKYATHKPTIIRAGNRGTDCTS